MSCSALTANGKKVEPKTLAPLGLSHRTHDCQLLRRPHILCLLLFSLPAAAAAGSEKRRRRSVATAACSSWPVVAPLGQARDKPSGGEGLCLTKCRWAETVPAT